MSKVIVDYRERSSGILKELLKHGVDVEEKQLIAGDFVLYGEGLDGRLGMIGVEKKTQQDFINSMIDKRLLKQLVELKENFEMPLLIIEGNDNIYNLRNVHPNAIRGMLAAIAIDYKIPIIHTKNHRDTAAFLVTLAKRLDRPIRNLGLLSRKKPLTLKEQQELIIESLPGVGPVLAKSLLKRFKSVRKVVNAKEDDLKKVKKIGEKKAKSIKDLFDKGYY